VDPLHRQQCKYIPSHTYRHAHTHTHTHTHKQPCKSTHLQVKLVTPTLFCNFPHNLTLPPSEQHCIAIQCVCVCVCVSHADERKLRISGGRLKRAGGGDDSMGDMVLLPQVHAVHAYVKYSGETRRCLRPLLIGRVKHSIPTSHSHTHTHTR